MKRYVLVEDGPYKGEELAIQLDKGQDLILECKDGKTLMSIPRSKVRYLPDNYKTIEEQKMLEEWPNLDVEEDHKEEIGIKDREIERLQQENNKLSEHLKTAETNNDHNYEEVMKGNQFRKKLKTALESLREELRKKEEHNKGQARMLKEIKEDLDRAYNVIDFITKPKEF